MIFSVREGTFGYKGAPDVLRGVSFEVASGELLAILGPNGIGKTTLLKCMMGFMPWRSGATYLDNDAMHELPQREVWKRMAYIPQAKDASFGFTGLEMTVMGRSAHVGTFRQPSEEDVSIARRAMERLGIEELSNKPCNEMSGGQYQMVLIARALATEPQLLVLDEPETGLDFRNQLVILDVLESLVREEGLAAIMNTHYPMHALKIADKTLMLGSECSYRYGPTAEVVTAENMRKIFRVEVAFTAVDVQGRTVRDVVPIAVA